MSDHMDGLHAVDQARREHEEELTNRPRVYDIYLCIFARWYHNHPESSRDDELNVTRDDDDNHLFREFLTYVVVKLLPVPEDEQEAWVVAVLDTLFQIHVTTIRKCLQDIMLINSRLIRIGRTPLFHRTLNIIIQHSVKILVPDHPLAPFPPRSSSLDEAYHVSFTDERNVPSATLKQVVPKCVVQIQLTKEAYAKDPHPPLYRKTLIALVDSGASASIVRARALPPTVTRLHKKRTTFNTQGGNFVTSGLAFLPFILPDFAKHRKVEMDFHIDDTITDNPRYDIILGRDFLTKLGIVLDFATGVMIWDGVSLNTTTGRTTQESILMAAGPSPLKLETVIPTYLNEAEKTGLAEVLHNHTELFQDGIGCFPGPALTVEPLVEPPLQPFYRKPYRIPHALIDDVKAKIDLMVKLGILKPNFNSPWGSPTLAVRKPNGDIRIVTYFRMVNSQLRRKPYPMPNISELFQRIYGYDFAPTLDLRLGFHHVLLSEYASNVFTTVLPWV
jgi:hypothetical protein